MILTLLFLKMSNVPIYYRINPILLVEDRDSMEGMQGCSDTAPEAFLVPPLTWSAEFTPAAPFPHLFFLTSPIGHSTHLMRSALTWEG